MVSCWCWSPLFWLAERNFCKMAHYSSFRQNVACKSGQEKKNKENCIHKLYADANCSPISIPKNMYESPSYMYYHVFGSVFNVATILAII